MIKSFGDDETESIWRRDYIRRYPKPLQVKVLRKLRFIDSAGRIEELMIPPSNRLEKMKGRWREYHSIRVNDQYRLWFKWENGHAYEVEFGDYHDRL